MNEQNPNAPTCQCGCGQSVGVYKRTNRAVGQTKGQPIRFLTGHHRRAGAKQYIVDPVTDCWEWQLYVAPEGYGRIGGQLAHRVFYEQRVGPIPEGMDVHHRCDNRRCVNPEHLEPLARRPHRRLDRRTKLTLGQAREIKAVSRAISHGTLAKRYGVSRELIYGIRRGIKWPDA